MTTTTDGNGSPGPLAGVRVVEMAALGPAPFGVMLLADLGADVVRVDRMPTGRGDDLSRLMRGVSRNRRSIAVDVTNDLGRQLVLELVRDADVFVEGYRPGVAERLGFGPDTCTELNPRLIYARMTGWGQDGPLAQQAGHDLNYLAIGGGLHPIGPADRPPVPPLNLVADLGGGGTYLAFGVASALFERASSGRGQVLDVAMVDGVVSLTALLHGMREVGAWHDERGSNFIDGSAPWYAVYETSDQRYLALGSVEPAFYTALLQGLGLDDALWPQHDQARWPQLRDVIATTIASRSQAEWVERFADLDACVSAVVEMAEAPDHPHLVERGAFIDVDGVREPAPAPRFSRTAGSVRSAAPKVGQDTSEVLAELGYAAQDIAELQDAAVVG